MDESSAMKTATDRTRVGPSCWHTGLDWTRKYPPVAAALSVLPAKQAYLDDELCGVGPDGKTAQRREGDQPPAGAYASRLPARIDQLGEHTASDNPASAAIWRGDTHRRSEKILQENLADLKGKN